MKVGTTELMKFHRLQRRLGESKRGLVGLLELLWQGTAKNTPAGDIGRFTDEEIAILCDWEGEPETLVDALVDTGWLDRSGPYRLVVHDWADHCPTYIKGNMAQYGKGFAKDGPKGTPKDGPKGTPKDDAKDSPKGTPKDGPIGPSYQAYPILSNSIQTKPEENPAAVAANAYPQEFEEFWSAYPPVRRNGKADTLKAWRQALKAIGGDRSAAAARLVSQARAYAASHVGAGEFSKSPASWLRKGCYDDDPASWGDPRQAVKPAGKSAIDIWWEKRQEKEAAKATGGGQ